MGRALQAILPCLLIAILLGPVDVLAEAVECGALPNPTGVGHAVEFACAPGGGVEPYVYSWDFDNDGTEDSQQQNPSHTYDVAGSYRACVTVTDSLGDTESCCVEVEVARAPVVACGGLPNPTEVGHAVAFACTPGGGVEPYTYSWDFNSDGRQESTEENPSHTYDVAGAYRACVTVTDAVGGAESCCVEVEVNPPLAAGCAASPNPARRGRGVSFTVATMGGVEPYTYAWDFDNDGMEDSEQQNPSHTYDVAGSYHACAVVTDSLGVKKDCCVDVTVRYGSGGGEDGAVGGNASPTLTPLVTPTPSPSSTVALPPSPTPAHSATPKLTPPLTPTRTPGPARTPTPVVTATPARTEGPTPTPIVMDMRTPSPTSEPKARGKNAWANLGPLIGLLVLGAALYYLRMRSERGEH